MSKSRKRQVNFIISENAYNQLTNLKEKRNSATMSEVIRDAIKTLQALESYREEDGAIVIEHDGKKIKVFI